MTELTALKGIGEKTAGALKRLGIFDTQDLLRYYPRDYERYEEPVPIGKLRKGTVGTIEAVLSGDASVNRYQGLTIVNLNLSDLSGRIRLSWFRMPYIRQSLKAGMQLVFRGRVCEKNGLLVMNQPQIYDPEKYRSAFQGKMRPVYSLCKGISNRTLEKAVASALSEEQTEAELHSEAFRERYGLMPLWEALKRIHFPGNEEEQKRAAYRLAFDEFFVFMLSARRLRESLGTAASVYRCRPDIRILRLIASLPFELTEDQQTAWKEILRDLSSGRVMSRLVEGDVGSGKTVLAVLSMVCMALNGYQAALMAPTGVLAQQHYDNLRQYLEAAELEIGCVLLTGSMTKREKTEACRRIEAHEASLIIGTHALFQEQVIYDRLGLIVTDEQHRFGVNQRRLLSEKGEGPHSLMLSATPIPRTLALMLYGDLEISMVRSKPCGRKPIKNCTVGPSYRQTAYRFILNEIRNGRQAYVICPAIESGEEEAADENSLCNVSDYGEELRRIFGDGVRIGILHGRMKAAEKDAVMEAFRRQETDLIVSTTVIEVGVDVPNATVIMIENAERFGLSELHQLRGRVGRGQEQSYCIMINTSDSDRAAERLEILNRSNDGFEIAEKDLELRGPGDFFGVRQSGELQFGIADIYRDKDALMAARTAADSIGTEEYESYCRYSEEHTAYYA